MQNFSDQQGQISVELGSAGTLEARHLIYAKAAAAEHEMDGELLRLPLFPTPLRGDWKKLLMAGRNVEDVYLQLSTAPSEADIRSLQVVLRSAISDWLSAYTALRRDLGLPSP